MVLSKFSETVFFTIIKRKSGSSANDEIALEILDDANRDLVTSDFVLLEVLPKSVYNNKHVDSTAVRAHACAAVSTAHRPAA